MRLNAKAAGVDAHMNPGSESCVDVCSCANQNAESRPNRAQERLAAIRREQEQEEVRECSFRPAINGRSSRLMSDRSAVLKV